MSTSVENSSLQNQTKIPLKIAKISIQKFNDVVVPNHVKLLENHNNVIEKSFEFNDLDKVKREEINANRVVNQLKNVLLEMDNLRNRIETVDLDKFDQLTHTGRRRIVKVIKDYLNLQRKAVSLQKSQNHSTQDSSLQYRLRIQQHNDIEEESIIINPIRSEFQIQEHKLKTKESNLAEFDQLYSEIKELHDIFHQLNVTVHEQDDEINVISNNVEDTQVNVENGERHLKKALKYKRAMYPVCGAIIGTCIGGPVGLLVGLKAGGLAAVGCGILGFTGGTVMKKHEQVVGKDEQQLQTESDKIK